MRVIDGIALDDGVEPYPDEEGDCHTCREKGWGIVGDDWSSSDPINGPYDGEVETCWNCNGSGLEADCWLF